LTNTFAAVVLASFVACGVTTMGIFVISRHADWARKYAQHFRSFAAGMLISISFLHLIPEALEMNGMAPAFLLGGFLGIYFTNRLVKLYACDLPDGVECTTGLIPVLGIGLHSLIDGVIYTVTFNVSILTGVLAALGMVFHEFPEGIVAFVLLEHGSLDVRRASLYAFLAAALSTPIGTLASYPLIRLIDRPALGALLAVSAGVLTYVGASHLLPEVEREGGRSVIVSLLAGVLVAVAIVVLGE